MVGLPARRRAAEHLEAAFGVSERRACRLMRLHRSSKRRTEVSDHRAELLAALHRLSERYPRFGDFLAARDRLDPQRVFRNAYLDRVLGA